jgi:hypothetical protein
VAVVALMKIADQAQLDSQPQITLDPASPRTLTKPETMPLRTIDLAAPTSESDRAIMESVRMSAIIESRYDNKVIRSDHSARLRFTSGTIHNQISLINAKTSDRGYAPYIGIAEEPEGLRENLCILQEAYLQKALAFVTKDGKTKPEEWTLVRPFDAEELGKTIYINHNGVDDNVCVFSGAKPMVGTNDTNYTGMGMATLNPRVSVNHKECKIVFKLVVMKVAIYQGREVTNFSDELYDVDAPEGAEMPVADSKPKKRSRNA